MPASNEEVSEELLREILTSRRSNIPASGLSVCEFAIGSDRDGGADARGSPLVNEPITLNRCEERLRRFDVHRLW